MSRIRHFTRAIFSGYAALAVNIVYTMASVPLALHYLPKEDFGLWALVMQIGGYLALIDLGVSGAAYRFLIDHKDGKDKGEYGAVLLTSSIVFALQGAMIVIVGWLLTPWLASALGLETHLRPVFERLVFWYCVVSGVAFLLRGPVAPLQSHQRFDVVNGLQAAQQVVALGALWYFFREGWGVYSMLFATAGGLLLQTVSSAIFCWQLRLLPPRGAWGRPRMAAAKELFSFGRDLFLMSVGWQLVSASQVIIVSRVLGLEAAAVWAVCTKSFALAQQFVWRIMDFSGPAFAEMYVRGEVKRLRERFRDVIMLTGSCAVAIGATAALSNRSFVELWTNGRLSWPQVNDALMAMLFICSSLTRCLLLWVGATKKIGGVRWIYICEGATFVGAAWLLAPYFSFAGIIVAAIVCDLLWAGGYGLFRTSNFFDARWKTILVRWLAPTWRLTAVLLPVGALLLSQSSRWPTLVEFSVASVGFGSAALVAFWFFGLSLTFRNELRKRLQSRVS